MAKRNPVAARRYAEALFQVCDGAENRVRALAELKAFLGSLEGAKELSAFFFNPVVPVSEKRSALDALKEKLPLTYRFLITTTEAGRLELLAEIATALEQMNEEVSGELSVRLRSAHALSSSALDEIRQLLQEKWKRKLKIQSEIDPGLIGGFVAQAPGKLLDASVASQLEGLEQQILAG